MRYKQFVIKNATKAFSYKVIGAFLGFSLQIILARSLGPHEYGKFIYLISLLTILASLSTLGFDSVLLRYLPQFKEEKKWAAYISTIQNGFLIPFSFSFFICLVIITLQFFFKNDTNSLNILIILILPFQVIIMLSYAGNLASKNVTAAMVANHVLRPLIMIISVLALSYLFGMKMYVKEAIYCLSFSAILSCAYGLSFFIKSLPCNLKIAKSSVSVSNAFKEAFPFFLISNFSIGINEFAIICMNWFLIPEEVATFGICMRISLLLAFALQATNSILNPIISELYHSQKRTELQETITHVAKKIMIISILAIIITISFGKYVLSVFGSEYSNAYIVLNIIIGGQFINSISGSVGSLMKMTGHHKQACYILGITFMVSIVIYLTLIPAYGLLGAAIGTTLSISTWNILMLIYVFKKVHINPTPIKFLSKFISK